ncbi:MAG: exonuclease SbcCD subunit D [Lachnospiraceae bacterium]|nr:exonuclease SbcCD subunit D [Lachnospiraceae bacterium]
MKFIHLSDLHLGKRVFDYSMLEDQEYILKEILALIDREAPDAVLIAGDVYDRSVAPIEAVELLDEFLVQLSRRELTVFLISGNHDSPERLAFAGRLIASKGIYVSPAYNGKVEPIVLRDAHGPLNVYLLPFVKPAQVRRFFPEAKIESYNDALKTAVEALRIDRRERNILVTHQFVTGAARSDSEEISVGGSDNIDAAVFEGFDYVALGHIHSPQNIGSERIRYCGSPLKYSFSEAKQEKSLTLLTMEEKGSLAVRTLPLAPLRDLREIEGSYEELTYRPNYEGSPVDDYLHITLTDEEDIPDAVGKLRLIYPNLMSLDYQNSRTKAAGLLADPEDLEHKSPLTLFEEFYEQQNGRPMSGEQKDFSRELMEHIWEESL